MKLVQFVSKRLPFLIVLLVNAFSCYSNTILEKNEQALPLSGGCAAPLSQTVFYENLPNYIFGSSASGGSCSGSYVYQWQWSTDNVFFQDIPNTNSQYLYFTTAMNFNTNQPLPYTIYVQRRTTCGAEVQYSNSVSITYVASTPIYARLEVTFSDSSFYESSDEIMINRLVEATVKFYSDDACTVPYTLAANISYQVKQCSHWETPNSTIDGCVPDQWSGIAYAGDTEAWLDNILGWEYIAMYYDYNTSTWVTWEKGWDDYDLIVAQNCIIKPAIYPSHSPGFGSQ